MIVIKRKQSLLPKRRLVYEGPTGRCPCCNKATEVKLGGTLGEPSLPGWVVPRDVLGHVYSEVAVRIKEKDDKLYVTDPSEYDSTVRSKFFFVDGDRGIAGPFGQRGLKVFLGSHFGEDHIENISVYIVTTTHRALGIIRKSPFAEAMEDGGALDDSADLF